MWFRQKRGRLSPVFLVLGFFLVKVQMSGWLASCLQRAAGKRKKISVTSASRGDERVDWQRAESRF